MKDVSVVIVCMNNLNNLLPCIDSIKAHTFHVSYEIWIVAYLFSNQNLTILKEKHPDVIVVESNEIRGFSENNNLALRQIKSKFAFVLNDDTLFKEPVLDRLCESMSKTPLADMMGCKMLNGDGSIQSCGKGPIHAIDFVLMDIGLRNPNMVQSKYCGQKGIFQSYNCTGACFLIKTDILKQLDYFDEYFFFMPEDLALSTKLNQKGYRYYVDSNINLYHLHQQTGSKVKAATLPAARKGCVHFFSNGNKVAEFILSLYVFISSFFKSIIAYFAGNKFNACAQWHCVESIFSSNTPKQIFTKYYLPLTKKYQQ